jgi:uracil-DNA glycosylase
VSQLSFDGDETAEALIPGRPSLKKLREAAAGCKACPLWETGTQTVFGEGSAQAEVVFVGEQPGDREDIEGRPFVGPAGKLLDEALLEARIDRSRVYVTNVVKHFKWKPQGKRRIHQKPNWREIAACRPWLDAEVAVLKPRVLVCLGATAAQALLGRDFRDPARRGPGRAVPGVRPRSREGRGPDRRELEELVVLVGVTHRVEPAVAADQEDERAADDRHGQEHPGVAPGKREPERGRCSGGAPVQHSHLLGAEAFVQLPHG